MPTSESVANVRSAESFDVVVLGAGSGGYTAAIRAAQLGKRVAIVEERFWGGVCLNIGCIPSKSLLRNAELVELLTHDAEVFGIHAEGRMTFDYATAHARSRRVVAGRVRGVNFLMRKNKITQYDGHGTFTGPNRLAIVMTDGSRRSLTFEHAIIACGADAAMLTGLTRTDRIWTYEDVINTPSVPPSIVIIGSGPVGVEFGYLFRCYGSDVTIVEAQERIVPNEDAEVSAELTSRFTRSGIKVLTSAKVGFVRESGDQVVVDVEPQRSPDPEGKASKTSIRAERVLLAIGFRPRTTGYGLEDIGVNLDGTGAIAVDGYGQTSVPHLYAIGDVTGQPMLAHAAETLGIIAAEAIAGVQTVPLDRTMIPRATFCHPQIASFGYTEEQARQRGYEVKVAKFPFAANGRAPSLGDVRGFAKLVTDRERGELLGAHLIGPEVAELLSDLTLAQMWHLSIHQVARNIHIHPTLGEAVKETTHGAAGHMINL